MKQYVSKRVRSSADETLDLVKSELIEVKVKPELTKFIKPFANGKVYTNDNYQAVYYAANGVFLATSPMREGDFWWDEYPTPSDEVPGYIWRNPITGIKGQRLAIKLGGQIDSRKLDIEDVHSKATFNDMDELLSRMGFTLVGTHSVEVYDGD